MNTHIITISAYLHNTIKRRSRGPLSDASVRILIRTTVFSQLCVKVSKLWTQNFEHFWKVTRPHIFSFGLIFDVDSDDLVQISKFKLFRIHRNKFWIQPFSIYDHHPFSSLIIYGRKMRVDSCKNDKKWNQLVLLWIKYSALTKKQAL